MSNNNRQSYPGSDAVIFFLTLFCERILFSVIENDASDRQEIRQALARLLRNLREFNRRFDELTAKIHALIEQDPASPTIAIFADDENGFYWAQSDDVGTSGLKFVLRVLQNGKGVRISWDYGLGKDGTPLTSSPFLQFPELLDRKQWKSQIKKWKSEVVTEFDPEAGLPLVRSYHARQITSVVN